MVMFISEATRTALLLTPIWFIALFIIYKMKKDDFRLSAEIIFYLLKIVISHSVASCFSNCTPATLFPIGSIAGP